MIRRKMVVILLIAIMAAGKIAADETKCFVENVNVKIERYIDSNCLTDFLRQYLQYAIDTKEATSDGSGDFYVGFFNIGHSQHDAWLQGTVYDDTRLYFQAGAYPQHSRISLLKNGWLIQTDMTDGSELCTSVSQLCRLTPSTSVQSGEVSQIIMQWFYATTENPNTDRIYLEIAF